MALVLNEEQVMLKESAAGFLTQRATVAHLRALRDSGSERGFSDDVWRDMAQMGWAGIAIPEAFGGLGYGYTGLGLVLEQAGRNLSASPLQSTVLVAATVIGELGSAQQKEQLLGAIAAGERLVSLALQEGPHHAPLHTVLRATLEADHYVLNGTKVLVLDASTAHTFIVIARTSDAPGDERGLSAFLVDATTPGLTVERRSLVDSRNAGALVLEDCRVSAANLLGAPGAAWPGLSRALDIANIGLAAELLGLSTEAFERTVAYLKERKQFGRVIGSFQGLAASRCRIVCGTGTGALYRIAGACTRLIAGERELSLMASAAKAKLCEVAQRATNEAIQMHGGVGMTDEYEIGFFIKRARVVQHTFGDYNYHLDRFARRSGF